MPASSGIGGAGSPLLSVLVATLVGMAGWDDVTTYEQLQVMTPQERLEHFRSCIILDPSTRPARERAHLEAIRQSMNEETLGREEHLRG